MKRFVDTEKFRKGFYRNLPAPYKLLWEYLICECDTIGLWTIEEDVAAIRIGKDVKVDFDRALELFNQGKVRVIPVTEGKKWFLKDFITFQYGAITKKHTMYKKIVQSLYAAGLQEYISTGDKEDDTLQIALPEGYHTPIGGYKDIYKDINNININNNNISNSESQPKLTDKEIAEKVISLYAECCPSLPKPLLNKKKIETTHNRLEDMKRKEILSRAKEIDPNIEDEWGVVRLVLCMAEESDFLTGRSGSWKCDYNWIFCEKYNWMKILEGKYSNLTKSGTLATGQIFTPNSGNSYNF